MRQIWLSGVSLKRSFKMQFRRVGLRSIGPSSQKLHPNLIFGPIAPLYVKLQKGCWVYNAGNFCVSFLSKLNPFFTLRGKKLGRPNIQVILLKSTKQENIRSLFEKYHFALSSHSSQVSNILRYICTIIISSFLSIFLKNIYVLIQSI